MNRGSNEAVATLFERGAQGWPTIVVDPNVFTDAVERFVDECDDPSGLRAVDLYLAVACVAGNPEALRAFEDELMPSIRYALLRMGTPDAEVDEVAQVVREKLLVSGTDRPPKLASYSGRGDLRRWLHVTATRARLNYLRDRGPQEFVDDAALEEVAIAAGPDPELALLRKTYLGEFREASSSAMAKLTAEERTLLRYRFVDGLTVMAIGRIVGAHRATVHRQLAEVSTKLAHHIEVILGEKLGVPRHDVASIRRLVRSQLSVSIGRLLG